MSVSSVWQPWKTDKNQWSYRCPPFPPGYLPTTFVDPCLKKLVESGFITKNSDVNQQTYKDTLHAWRAPSGLKIQSTKHYHAHQTMKKTSQLLGALLYNHSLPVNLGMLHGHSDCHGAHMRHNNYADQHSTSPVMHSKKLMFHCI